VGFKEGDQRGKQGRVVRPTPEFIRPDSGQRKEPLRPALVTKRCRKRSKSNGYGIVWFLVWHSLGNSRRR
jgi:hypothetical protein